MKMVDIQLTVPESMAPYFRGDEDMQLFERNAMLLYPYIKRVKK